MMRRLRIAAALAPALLLGLPAALLAQAGTGSFELDVPSIMRGPELVGEGPRDVRWTDDSREIYFRWKPGGEAWDDEADLWRVAADGGSPARLSEEAADSVEPYLARGDLSPDRRFRVVAVDGDLHLVDREEMTDRLLTSTREREGSPTFSRDGSAVYFTRAGNVFALELEGGAVRQVTDIRKGPPDEEDEAEGREGLLEAQQAELLEHIRIEREREERREAEEERDEAGWPEPVHIGEDERVAGLSFSPAGGYALLRAVRPPRDARETLVPDYVTESGYTEELEARPKVGDAQSSARLGLVDVASGEVEWLDLVPDADSAGEGSGEERSGTPDLATARFLGWNDAGTAGLVLAVDFDYEEWRLYALDAGSGELTPVASHRDEAWVGGPCFRSCRGWIPGSDRIYYVSEATGWAHLYTVRADGSDRRALTSGEWEVRDVSVSPDRSHFHLTTSEVSPFDEHGWTMAFDGSERRRLTVGDGHFDVVPSPDGERVAVVHSAANRPPELYVGDHDDGLAPGDGLRRVTVSPTGEWRSGPWIRPEIVRVPAGDGVRVPGRVYRPADLGAEPNGAAVIFVHGAGYLQNVHHGWSGYYREYMFHHLLASRGYTVLDLDYRGSAGHGREWRTAIHRRMGGKDLSDQVDGARWLAEHEGVDPERIGIYGGSYGGFITLMALFTEAETFAAGAALRSVTDWTHYNHWYTSRILNLPQGDEEAYERSSPIYFAEGLEDPLLIAHGMRDTNVHFQDVVRLAQRLIELGKEGWEMAVYPVEDHGFREPTSWTDEYRRILGLFERHLGTGEADR